MKLQKGIFHKTEGLIILTEIVQNCFYQWKMEQYIVLYLKFLFYAEERHFAVHIAIQY
jgi:hypothetical protein